MSLARAALFAALVGCTPSAPDAGATTETARDTALDTGVNPWLAWAEAILTHGITWTFDGESHHASSSPGLEEGDAWPLRGEAFADGQATLTVLYPATMPWKVDQVEMRFDGAQLTDVDLALLDADGGVLARDTSSAIGEDHAYLRVEPKVSPTGLRFELKRAATTDTSLVDLMVHPWSEDEHR